MKKDPEIIQELIKYIEPPLILSVEKEKKIKEAIKNKNTKEEKVISKPRENIVKVKKQEDYDILGTLDKTKKLK